MIVTRDYITEDGRLLIRTKSDRNMMIRQDQTGILYDEAIDVPNHYTYSETDVPIESEDPIVDDPGEIPPEESAD